MLRSMFPLKSPVIRKIVLARTISTEVSDFILQWKSVLLNQEPGHSVELFIKEKWQERKDSYEGNTLKTNHVDNKKYSFQRQIEPSLPKMVADIVEMYGSNVHSSLAMDTISHFSHLNPHYHHVGLLHLVDAYLEVGDLQGAQECYEKLLRDGLSVDLACAERFMVAAAKQCSIPHMKLILQHHHVSRNMLLVVTGPLILSGYSKTLSQLLEKYVSRQPSPSPLDVALIVREILKARIRRSLTDCPLSPLEEEGVHQIELLLSSYTETFENEVQLSVTDEIALQGIDNYVSFCSDWSGERPPDGLPYPSYNKTIPSDPNSQFNYLEEHRTVPYPHHLEEIDQSHSFLFEDITSQIAKQRPFVYPLYDGNLFKDEMEREILYAEAVANDIFFALDGSELLQAVEDNEDDENAGEIEGFEGQDEFELDDDDTDDEFSAGDDDEDEEDESVDDEVSYELEVDNMELLHDESSMKFFDKMRSAGNAKSLAHSDFNDMSQSIKSAYSTIMLEYAEDIFDGISEDTFVRDSLMNKSKRDGKINSNSNHMSSSNSSKKLIEGAIVEDAEKKGPDDEGGVTVGLQAPKFPAIFKEES